ncbi:hypothetical protein BpHYR1_000015 [Brachionus plicatilis]|uniref:Uncharacterized protein n=1 Tax=Brachionus plicatilis TaxID=10195 RepID=A0A3M7RXE8_BRAPC|nr:hypothetical protein BpHYR1_000015 [Brachionus plicatilis]
MAGQILENREVAGRLWAKIKTDRVVAGQLKGIKPPTLCRSATKRRIYFLSKIWIRHLSKIFFLDRFVAGRPPHGQSVSWRTTSRSVFILADKWPAISRFSKIWPAISRSVRQLAAAWPASHCHWPLNEPAVFWQLARPATVSAFFFLAGHVASRPAPNTTINILKLIYPHKQNK